MVAYIRANYGTYCKSIRQIIPYMQYQKENTHTIYARVTVTNPHYLLEYISVNHQILTNEQKGTILKRVNIDFIIHAHVKDVERMRAISNIE